jgi:radical SAM superfamily enzyme YgiQ (UPF0313 family)
MHVALVNTNRVRPPIAPIGLEYVAQALQAAGHQVHVLDLCWEPDPRSAISGFFSAKEHGLVGVTIRNTDDCAYTSRASFVPAAAEWIQAIRSCTAAPVVLGGVGFSVMPERVLDACGAEYGIWADGEFAFTALADRLAGNGEWKTLPHLVWKRDGKWRRNSPRFRDLSELPAMRRNWFDNLRYFREGGQAGFETKRGCPCSCTYCADPLAKGNRTRVRPPEAVIDELEAMLQQGIDCLHTCDHEFNIPEEHAKEVCRALIRRGLAGRLRWYAYCAPVPFSPDLAGSMARAGCVGVNFGVDSGDPGMLRTLGRNHRPEHILRVADLCREHGMAVMFDLVLGGPGETEESLAATVACMRRARPDRVGVNAGVRVYPGTRLERQILRNRWTGGFSGGPDPVSPVFFLEPSVSPVIFENLSRLVQDDPLFLFMDPRRPFQNYNYNANDVLVEAIRGGERGAYWDILRRTAGKS